LLHAIARISLYRALINQLNNETKIVMLQSRGFLDVSSNIELLHAISLDN
jgi:hypothetical protein